MTEDAQPQDAASVRAAAEPAPAPTSVPLPEMPAYQPDTWAIDHVAKRESAPAPPSINEAGSGTAAGRD